MKQLKLSFDLPEFFIDEEKGVTVCKLTSVLKDENRTMYYEFNTIGKAKVSGNDTFDSLTGRRISFAKAESKAYNKTSKILEKVTINYIQSINTFRNFTEKAENCVEKNNKYIEQYL